MSLRSSATGDEDGRTLARAREHFLTSDLEHPSGVRQAILASWWRSRESQVDADRLQLQYLRDPDLDTPLTRSAEPVLHRLRDQLDGQSVSIVLTDASGVVLSRSTADAALERQLDRVHLAPGFSYAESVVGTNGIGTALEAGGPVHVFGHEHYAEDLEQLACAGVPVRHPVTGRTVGVLDLTCWRRDAGPLLVTLAKATAEQIRQALLAETGAREMELLHAYIRACRHSSGMVFALNNDVVMLNATARTLLDAADQESLLRHGAEVLAAKRESAVIELPSGTVVRLHARSVTREGLLAGGVVDVKVVPPAVCGTAGGVSIPAQAAPGMLLPGLVGTGALWRRACDAAETAYRADGWLVLEGERGVGKLALLKAVHHRVEPGRRLCVLDPAEAGTTEAVWLTRACTSLADEDGVVVLRHVDQLSARALRRLGAALQEAAQRDDVRVVLCLPEGELSAETARLLLLFPATVHVPPLRHHADDVAELVPFLLHRLGTGGAVTCAPETLQVLSRAQWPGNVQQLLDTLRHVLRSRRSGVVLPGELPPETGSLCRRRLSTLESLERDAIARGLRDAGGNKAEAARALGMSRATIYRKINDYGIVTAVTT